jgi:lysophospholipase L1-like esterase
MSDITTKTRILCYGDSNTRGDVPRIGGRLPLDSIWPSVLERKLDDDFKVINAGVWGRTFATDDHNHQFLNGKKSWPLIHETFTPMDIIILMLGSNDFKSTYEENSAEKVLNDCKKLLTEIDYWVENETKLILLKPPKVNQELLNSYDPDYWQGAEKKQHRFIELLDNSFLESLELKNLKLSLHDPNNVANVSSKDGLHLDLENHKKLAEYLFNIINKEKI